MKRTVLGSLAIVAAVVAVQSAGAQQGPAPMPVPPMGMPTTAPAPAAPKPPEAKVIKVPDPAQVLKDFAAAAAQSPAYDAAARDAIAKAAAAAVDPADPGAQADAVGLGLARAYPEFAKALLDLGDEQLVTAIGALQKQRQSADIYLAAYATYFLARAYVAQEAYEQALPLLGEVTGKYLDKTTYSGEALFLRGVCERKTLKREAALQSFTDFLKNYVDAPERLRIGAETQQWELLALAKRPLDDVQDRMDFSHNRLAREKSDKEITQAEQNRIIAILDKLIKEAEDKEKKGGGGGGGGGGSGQDGGPGGTTGGIRPKGGANQSTAPTGQTRYGSMEEIRHSNPGESWGTESEKREREKVNEVMKSKFPDRYRALLDQYYKGLSEEKDK